MQNSIDRPKPTLEISLALSGGAARGVFHLGFIQALQENSVSIKAISATSAGAIVGGAIACGLEPRDVLKTLKSKEFRKIFSFNWFTKSVFSINYEADVIKKLFPLQDIQDTKIPFCVCVTDMDNSTVLHIESGDAKKFIIASSSLIPIFAPFIHENKVLADGGLLELMPTKPLLKHNYPILGINLLPTQPPNKYNFYSSLKRGCELLLHTTLPNDIQNCTWYVAPQELKTLKLFSLSNLDKGFELGYQEGLKWCNSQL